MNNACGTTTTCDEGDSSSTVLLLFHSANHVRASGGNLLLISDSERVRDTSSAKLQQDGGVKFSYFVIERQSECRWPSLTWDQVSRGVGGESDCECYIQPRQDWWSACEVVKRTVCWQGGWLGTVPCWRGSCSDTAPPGRTGSFFIHELREQRLPGDALSKHCHRSEHTCSRVHLRAPVCANTCSSVH